MLSVLRYQSAEISPSVFLSDLITISPKFQISDHTTEVSHTRFHPSV